MVKIKNQKPSTPVSEKYLGLSQNIYESLRKELMFNVIHMKGAMRESQRQDHQNEISKNIDAFDNSPHDPEASWQMLLSPIEWAVCNSKNEITDRVLDYTDMRGVQPTQWGRLTSITHMETVGQQLPWSDDNWRQYNADAGQLIPPQPETVGAEDDDDSDGTAEHTLTPSSTNIRKSWKP